MTTKLFCYFWLQLFIGLVYCLGGPVRVATYNVCNYLVMDRYLDGAYLPDYPKPEEQKKALHDIILHANPDVLALQEMGTMEQLKELRQDLRARGIDYPYISLLQGPDPDRHLALLSKIPYRKILPHQLNFKYQKKVAAVKRGLMEAEFQTDGVSWTLYVVHLKSKWTVDASDPDACDFRYQESKCIRNFIKKNHPKDHNYLIVGDFNDAPNSPTLKLLSQGQQPLSVKIPSLDSRNELWTYFYKKEGVYSQVDYILSSKALMNYIKDSKSHIEDLFPSTLQASDHRMVYVDLNF